MSQVRTMVTEGQLGHGQDAIRENMSFDNPFMKRTVKAVLWTILTSKIPMHRSTNRVICLPYLCHEPKKRFANLILSPFVEIVQVHSALCFCEIGFMYEWMTRQHKKVVAGAWIFYLLRADNPPSSRAGEPNSLVFIQIYDLFNVTGAHLSSLVILLTPFCS